ncbi:MAG: triose-phosphate isomerase [Halanaerobium sp.]
MNDNFKIKVPFLNVGVKAYKYGNELLEIIKQVDDLILKYETDLILTPQAADIRYLADNTKNIIVFAQHIDPIQIGRGHGSILAEAVKEAGADGVVLNHAEKSLKLNDIYNTVKRAEEIGLATMICVDNEKEAAAAAKFEPDIILAEPSDLIGSGSSSGKEYAEKTIHAVKSENENIKVLQGAGINSSSDVEKFIKAGAEAVGAASGIMLAEDPTAKIEELLAALHESWNS